MNYQPLQIDFYLSSDIVLQNPIHFDALLQYYAIEADDDNGITYDYIKDDYPLPIRKIQVKGRWFYDCSNSILEVKRIRQDTIKKKLCLEGLKKKNVSIAGTYYGVRMITFERKQVEFVRFFVYGNKQELKLLLDRMKGRNLGMMRAKGFGLINDIKISGVSMSYAFIHDGILLRDIPIDVSDIFFYFADGNVILKKGRYRPPYYDMVKADKDRGELICQGSKIDISELGIRII
jgi:hypothetical protein